MALPSAELTTLKTELFGGASPLATTYATIESTGGDQSQRDQLLAEAINATDTNRTVISIRRK